VIFLLLCVGKTANDNIRFSAITRVKTLIFRSSRNRMKVMHAKIISYTTRKPMINKFKFDFSKDSYCSALSAKILPAFCQQQKIKDEKTPSRDHIWCLSVA